MTLSASRLLTPGRFYLLAGLALLVLVAFPELASAQDSDAPVKKKNIIVHMIESVGWVFGPMLLAVSVITNVILLVVR